MNMKSLKKWLTVALSISLLSACALAPQKAEALEQSDDMRAGFLLFIVQIIPLCKMIWKNKNKNL